MAQNSVTFTLNDFLPNQIQGLERAYNEGLKQAAILVHAELVRTLRGQRSGRLYRVPGTKRTYKASAPEEPPASRLGHLRTSYQYKVLGTGSNTKAFVGTNTIYAHYLEYGTAKMGPRPHLIPAMVKAKPKIERLFKGILK